MLCIRHRNKSIKAPTEEFKMSRKYPVSSSPIRNTLIWKFDLRGRVAARKPLLRRVNIVKRLKWAKAHYVNSTFEQWCKVLWTDEYQFVIFGNNRRIMIRRMPGERYRKICLLPTVKHGGGSVMIWGDMSGNGVAPIKRRYFK